MSISSLPPAYILSAYIPEVDAKEIESAQAVQAVTTSAKKAIPNWEQKKALLQQVVPKFRSLDEPKQEEVKEFLRRVVLEDVEECCKEMARIGDNSSETQASLSNLDWNHRVFSQKDVAHRALREYLSGRLERDKLVEILLHLECTHFADARLQKKLTLFHPDGTRNQEGVDLLKKGVQGNALYVNEPENMFSEEDVEQFLSDIDADLKAGKITPNRTQIYSISIPNLLNNRLLMEQFLEFAHPLFLHKENGFIQTVVSPSLFFRLCRAKFGANTIEPNPVLGSSLSLKNFAKTDKRDVAIPCEFLFRRSMPQNLHNYEVTPLVFFKHDQDYHVYIDSSNRHRKAWNELASLFDPQNEHEKEVIIKFFDREMRLYRPLPHQFFKNWSRPGLEDNTRFWLTFIGNISSNNTQTKYIFNKILDYIKKNQISWKDKYNIEIPNSEDIKLFRHYVSLFYSRYNNAGITRHANLNALEAAFLTTAPS